MAQHTTPERRPGKVSFFPPPNEDGGLWFRVLVGRRGGAGLTIRGAVEVGGLELPRAGTVAVIVRPVDAGLGVACRACDRTCWPR
jgi:hypothetical protein